MSTPISTQWRIVVGADTKAARSELTALAKVAQTTGSSMEQVFSNVAGAPVARTFNNLGRELDRMNKRVMDGKVQMKDYNRYWRNSNNLIKHSKQLQAANYVSIERTNGAMASATVTMQRFGQVAATTGERLAYMNTFFQKASRQAINAAKNIQWAGRQIQVGFGLPFGIAMFAASKSFLDFEEQVVRFRKVFNDEVDGLSIEDAEQRIVNLGNTMATQLGVVRTEVLETAATFAQMGYATNEIERLTKAATELAMLGEFSPSQATDILRAYSASGFKDQFDAMGRGDEFEEYVKNLINAIENTTGLTIEKFAQNGAQLIPLFSQFNLQLGEGEAIIAGMTEALGGRANEAATAFKAIAQRMYDDTKETEEQFAEIGINLQALQEKNKGDLVGFMQDLGEILSDNPVFDENNLVVAETFGNLFGVRQANRAIAALRSVSAETSDYTRALENMGKEEENARKAAQELAAQAESLGGRLRRLKETILIEASQIGETFLEMIMPLAEAVGRAIESFGNLDKGMQRFIMMAGLGAVAIGTMLTTVGVLGQAILYAFRMISGFAPKFKIVDEATTRTRIATDHLDESLRSTRNTVQSIVPIWQSIEQATRDATRQAEHYANTMRGVTGSGAAGAAVAKKPFRGASAGNDPFSIEGMGPRSRTRKIGVPPMPHGPGQLQYAMYDPVIAQSAAASASTAQRRSAQMNPGLPTSRQGVLGVSRRALDDVRAGRRTTPEVAEARRLRTAERSRIAREQAALRARNAANQSAASRAAVGGIGSATGIGGNRLANSVLLLPGKAGKAAERAAAVAAKGKDGVVMIGGKVGRAIKKAAMTPIETRSARSITSRWAGEAGRRNRLAASRTLDRNRATRAGAANRSVKWRGGASKLGAIGMMGGMLAPGGAGEALMTGGFALQAASGLSSKKVVNRMTALSDSLILSRKNAGGFVKYLKTGAGRLVGMLTTLKGFSVVLAVVVAAANHMWKIFKRSQEAAESMKNEFQLMEGIRDQIGAGERGDGFRLMGQGETEEMEDLNEETKLFAERVHELRRAGNQAGIDAMFRNVARDLALGGMDIDEINQKLNELGAIVNVEVDDTSMEELAARFGDDISESVRVGLSKAAFDAAFIFRSIFQGGTFDLSTEQALRGTARSIKMAMETGAAEGAEAAQRVMQEVELLGLSPEDEAEALRIIQEELNVGMSNAIGRQAKDLEEAVKIASVLYAEEQGRLFTPEEMKFLEEMAADGREIIFTDENDVRRLNGALADLQGVERILNARGIDTGLSGLIEGGVGGMSIDALNAALREHTSRLYEVAAAHGITRNEGEGFEDFVVRVQQELAGTDSEAKDVADAILAINTAIGIVNRSGGIRIPVVLESASQERYNDAEMNRLAGLGQRETAKAEQRVKDKNKEAIEEQAEDDVEDYTGAFRSALDAKRDELISALLEAYDEATERMIERIEEQREAEVSSLDERIEKIDEYLDRQREIYDAMQEQIDLTAALASGDRVAAAQLQNSMRFGDIEGMADEAKSAIEEERDQVSKLYDERIEREQELRDKQRKGLEDNLEDLKDMFIGTQDGWDKFISRAGQQASAAGVKFPQSFKTGFQQAIEEIKIEMRLDELWDSIDYEWLKRSIKSSVSDGMNEGMVEGANDAADAIADKYDLDLGSVKAKKRKRDTYNRAPSSSPGGKPDGWYDPRDVVDLRNQKPRPATPGSFFHSGGKVGGGPPRDVPATLQTGEYVIQRKAAQKLGTGFLDSINKYHEGGLVHQMGRGIGAKLMSKYTDAEPHNIPRTVIDRTKQLTGLLQPPDQDRTWRYSNWMVGVQEQAARKFANSLARLAGGQLVTSAYRSAAEQRAIGGVPGSDHVKGKGFDFVSANGNSLSKLNQMGRYFQSQPGVRWVGMPATDPGGGHNDHVHVSYYHGGGAVKLNKGGRLKQNNVPAMLHRGETVLRAPVARSLEDGIRNLNKNESTSIMFNIENMTGDRKDLETLADMVVERIDRRNQTVNPTRKVG